MSKNTDVVKPNRLPYSKSDKISNKKKKKSLQISASFDATPLVTEMYRNNIQMAKENAWMEAENTRLSEENARMEAELDGYRTLRPRNMECVEGNIVEVECEDE